MTWSDLPIDLLYSISSHLPIVDFLRFSVVCTSWKFVYDNNILQGIHYRPSPWLLLPNDAGEASNTLNFYDIAIKEEDGLDRHHHLSFLDNCMYGRRCIGSKDGWLVTLDKIDLQPHIFNPLTNDKICLPSLFTIPEDEFQRIKCQYASDGSIEYFYNEIHQQYSTGPEDFREVYFLKIVVSSNDSYGTAVVIYGYKKQLALAKPDDQAWALGPQIFYDNTNYLEDFNDVFYHKEEKRFYAITHSSKVLAFDPNGQNIEIICPSIQDEFRKNGNSMNYIFFLLGNLFKIERETEFFVLPGDEKFAIKTIKISVFKLGPDFVTSSGSFSQWISVMDLKGFSLFIGCNQTFALHHKDAHGIKPNCVYFTDHYDEMSSMEAERDFGIFDLQNDCFQYFLDSNSQPNWPPTIWFMPSLK